MSETAPHELLTAVLGPITPSSQRLVLNRRGSTVWDVESDEGRYAVKLGYPIEATPEWPAQEWTARAPGREGVILRHLGVDATHGEWERGTWNVQPWREGTSLYDLWEPCRAEKAGKEPDLGDALSCTQALASLHAHGWAHGDIQPAHLLVGTDRTHLIDLALAHGGPIPDAYDFPSQGCLVHYEAPEISKSVLATGYAVPTMEADVYALGASLLISATGWRAVAYPDDAPRAVQRQAVVDGPHRPVTVAGPLGKVIEAMLSPVPGDRPTSAEVCRALSS
ncbi:protein kinase [Streptomyces sp. KLMMK]|uniref:protein kinase n=1 Tax=Streptomyces sp. KLMMK TaxID=3109353 RepID=UPI002FFD97DB